MTDQTKNIVENFKNQFDYQNLLLKVAKSDIKKIKKTMLYLKKIIFEYENNGLPEVTNAEESEITNEQK
jgi:hypothetical protein